MGSLFHYKHGFVSNLLVLCIYFQMIHHDFYIADCYESALLLLSTFYTGCGGNCEHWKNTLIKCGEAPSDFISLVGCLSPWHKLTLSEEGGEPQYRKSLCQIAQRQMFLTNDCCRWALGPSGAWVVEESKQSNLWGQSREAALLCGLCSRSSFQVPTPASSQWWTALYLSVRNESFSFPGCFWSWHSSQQKKPKTTSFDQNTLVVFPLIRHRWCLW